MMNKPITTKQEVFDVMCKRFLIDNRILLKKVDDNGDILYQMGEKSDKPNINFCKGALNKFLMFAKEHNLNFKYSHLFES